MAKKLQFREKLTGILKICESKENVVLKEEVEAFFQEDNLTPEQMELVFDYLLSQRVIVKGYVKAGGSVIAASGKEGNSVFSSEEEQYLAVYEKELQVMKGDEPFAALLPRIVEMAKEMHRPEVFIGDLIQEGNMGMMLAASQTEEEETMLLMARESMQALLESQTEMKLQDRKMVEKVNNLDEQIKKLTEEMGRKISVDELVELMGVSEEEIEDILRLAGE